MVSRSLSMPHIHFSPFSNRNLTIFYISSTIFTKSARRTPQPNPHKSLFQASKTKNAQKRPKFPLFRSHLNNCPPTIRKRSHSHGNGQKSNHAISGRSPHILHVPFATDARAWEVCWDGHQNFFGTAHTRPPKNLDPNFSRTRFWNPNFRQARFFSRPKFQIRKRRRQPGRAARGGPLAVESRIWRLCFFLRERSVLVLSKKNRLSEAKQESKLKVLCWRFYASAVL